MTGKTASKVGNVLPGLKSYKETLAFLLDQIKDLLCTFPNTTTNLTTQVTPLVSPMSVFHEVSVDDVYTLRSSSK